jgi:hypothetical protein
MGAARHGRVDDHLCQPPAIAQVNKDQAAVVPTTADPSCQGDLLTYVLATQLSAIVCL